jgi:hypothetical protein
MMISLLLAVGTGMIENPLMNRSSARVCFAQTQMVVTLKNKNCLVDAIVAVTVIDLA